MSETLRATCDLPPELRETYDMVRAAFPLPLPHEYYRPVMRLLAASMSLRQLANLMAHCTGRTYAGAYNDALGIETTPEFLDLPPALVADAEARLRAHGYEAWLASE